MHSRPVAWRQVSQWQKVTPEKRSLSSLGLTVCLAAPQWHETVMVLIAESIGEIGRDDNPTAKEAGDRGFRHTLTVLYQHKSARLNAT